MITVNIPAGLFFNETDQSFIETAPVTIQIEHSLAAISKWEQEWEKPFFGETKKTREQVLDYIRCMTISPENVDPNAYLFIPSTEIEKIGEYMDKPMTSIRWPNSNNDGKTRTYGKPSKETITSELIYHWMFAQSIPLECENWHINKLLSVIRMCSVKNTPPKKTNSKALLARNAQLNAARRKALGTTG